MANRHSPTGIDRQRIGFFGFSRGGYTGLVLIGANPDWARAAAICQGSSVGLCAQAKRKEYPTQPLVHDARIKVAVLADPLAIFFTADSLATIQVPVQLWASERGGDGVLPHDVASVDKYLRVEHEYHVVPNAGHFAFLTPCPPELATQLPEICKDAPGFDRAAFHRQFDAEVLELLSRPLGQGPMTSTPDAIIVGAGPAGLACAATMQAAGLNATVLEKAGNVGSAWRRHYDRLHLHTDRGHSGLPGLPMPRSYPAYPSRAQMVAYLEGYAERLRSSRFSTRRSRGFAVTVRDGVRTSRPIQSRRLS